MPSEVIGPAFLAILLAVAFFLAARGRSRCKEMRIAIPAACVTLALQALHVAEEFATGFHHRLPALLGLDPWSSVFFLSFNCAWLALWSLAIGAIATGRLLFAARVALLFLALAACGNALWHPALSLATAAYFPGTATALALGPAGFILARLLLTTETRA